MSEDYPGQAYVHKYNANIKRAEEKAMSEQRAARGEGLAGLRELDSISDLLHVHAVGLRSTNALRAREIGVLASRLDRAQVVLTTALEAAPAGTAQLEIHNESTPGAVKPEPLVYRQSHHWTGKEACRKELFSKGETHYCHLLHDHEGDCEWFYSEKQLDEELHQFAVRYRRAEEPIRAAALTWFDKYYNQVVLTQQLLEAQAAALATPSPQAPPQCTCYMEANEATNGPCPIHNAPAATQEQPAGSALHFAPLTPEQIKANEKETAALGLLTAEDVESSILFSTGTFIDYAIAAASLNRKVRERLGGSPRKVGEDGAHADDSYKCENGHTFNAQAHSPYDLPPEHCPECGNRKVTLARPSSVPVGEQKQEEGVSGWPRFFRVL